MNVKIRILIDFTNKYLLKFGILLNLEFWHLTFLSEIYFLLPVAFTRLK